MRGTDSAAWKKRVTVGERGMSTITRIKGGGSNCYLLANGTEAVLVDSGVKRYKTRILECLRGYDVRLILLTHGHIDHIENAMYFSELLKVPVAIHPKDDLLSKNNQITEIRARSYLGYNLKGATEKRFKNMGTTGVEATVFLEDGQSLNEYGIPDARIILLGGHTAGSIGVRLEDGSLIVGDVFMNFIRPVKSLIAEDFDLLDGVIERIGEMEITMIYPGHGAPFPSSRFFKKSKTDV